MHSHTSTFVRELLHEYVNDRLADHLFWDVGRANDFRGLCTAVYYAEKGAPGLPSIPMLTKWLQETDEYDDEFVQDVHQTFKIFVWMAEDKECSKCFNLKRDDKQLKVSPAEFVSIFVLIHRHKSKLTVKQLSDAIRKMRLDIRKLEQDIRLNNRCMKILQNFIKDLKSSDLKSDSTHSSAAVSIKRLFKGRPKDEEESEPETKTKSSKKVAGKRKREDDYDVDDNDDDADYTPKRPPATQRIPTSRQSVRIDRNRSLNTQASQFAPSHHPHQSPQPTQVTSLPPPTQPASMYNPQPAPSTSQHPPTAPRMHPDRLAALHAAKSGVPIPQYMPADPRDIAYAASALSQPSEHPSSQVPYQPRWDEQPLMRMGPVISGSEVLPPPPPPPPPSTSLRSPVVGAYADDPGMRSHPLPPPPPYSTSRPVSHGRDDYYDRGFGRRYSTSRY